ncbi:MAG: hypothetical protein CMD35_01385 [Flavobacteriales bacterium]|nr:hypothetical protein [Flavobacteriales bacterium]
MKVNIAGKEYPVKISSSELEEVNSVELEIKDKLKVLQSNYGVKDKQDLLAMLLFQNMMVNKKNNMNSKALNSGLHSKLEELDECISNYLKS